MTMAPSSLVLLRTLCFFDAIGYPPCLPELFASADEGTLEIPQSTPPSSDAYVSERGRVAFTGRRPLFLEHERRERLFARKIRRARRVAAWLVRLGGVRFVAICNTTALAHADEQGDLDFFIITKTGTIWQTRALAALPCKLLGLRPDTHATVDSVCLSFFIDDCSLDLQSLALSGDDVYLRYWFLSLLPLYDDGIGGQLWDANAWLRKRHPWAIRWVTHPEYRVRRPLFRVPSLGVLEQLAHRLQVAVLGENIREQMNKNTHVVVNDHVLKFHVQDGREAVRRLYEERCAAYGISS